MKKLSGILLNGFMCGSLLLLAGCGGGGGSETSGGGAGGSGITGLEMPSKMNMVSADSTGARNYGGRGYALDEMALGQGFAGKMVEAAVIDAFPTDADYYLDANRSETWVWDPSMESLSIVNEILCYVEQTAAKEMVNKGAYIALVDEDKCEEGVNQSGASSGGAQSTAGNAQTKNYSKWTVISSRADADSAQIVRIWVPGDASEDPMDNQRILVHTTITEGVSSDKPFGSFVLNFVGESQLPGSDAFSEVMQGTLKTVENAQGKPEFSFINTGGGEGMPFSMTEKSHVVMDDASGSSGQAKTYMQESFTDHMDVLHEKEHAFSVAYDNTHFLRGKDTNGDETIDDQVCTSRDSYTTQTWRYNLYHTGAGSFNGQSVTAGQRVALNSGFPFVYTDGGETHFGHIGYWGIWTEDDLSLTDLADQTITREQFGEGTPEHYTVKVSGGKLWRRTKEVSSYAEVVDADLNWWGDPTNPMCEGPDPCNQADYRATVVDNPDDTYSLMVTSAIEWSDNGGPTLTPLDTPVDITPANDWEQRWLWADSLGGSVVFKPASAGEEAVVMFKEEVVSPGEDGLPTQLYCYERCLKGGLTADSVITQESDLYHILWNEGGQEQAYTLAVEDGQFVLSDGTGPVVVDFAISGDVGDWYQWGINTGEMVASQVPADEWWSVFEGDVTYRWETGTNSWNRSVAVINQSTDEAHSFDKPMHFKYVYAAGDDPNGDAGHAAGMPFMLEYGGQGELWGFPWTKLDDECDESEEYCRWVSTLTLKNGVELNNGSAYLVLPMESEQSMNPVALEDCTVTAGLDVEGIDLDLPSTVSTSVDFTWSDKPVVTDAPAVIEGEVQ